MLSSFLSFHSSFLHPIFCYFSSVRVFLLSASSFSLFSIHFHLLSASSSLLYFAMPRLPFQFFLYFLSDFSPKVYHSFPFFFRLCFEILIFLSFCILSPCVSLRTQKKSWPFHACSLFLRSSYYFCDAPLPFCTQDSCKQ